MNLSSFEILNEYLKLNEINLQLEDYLTPITYEGQYHELSEELIDNIIVDAYKAFSEEVKSISHEITNRTNVYLGRQEKIILKTMIDYADFSMLDELVGFIKEPINLKELILETRNTHQDKISTAKNTYLSSLMASLKDKNHKRTKDYLNFLYSRLLVFNEYHNRSLEDIYKENEVALVKEFGVEETNRFFSQLKDVCKQQPYKKVVATYNEQYIKSLIEHEDDLYDTIFIRFGQDEFDQFNKRDEFLSYVLESVQTAYSKLRNHRTLAVKIDNIICNNINIKWDVSAYLTVYAEYFKSHKEERNYYHPEAICFDYIEHRYGVKDEEKTKTLLKEYYQSKDYKTLLKNLGTKIPKDELDYFVTVHNAFSFVDCFVLKRSGDFPNSAEISFIKTHNELLLIFSKNEFNEKKISCPVCASMKISGNSYPEVGIKSWECKNEYCSERSKTNRGKRYSLRSIEMQSGLNNHLDANIISKELIAKWRKDIINEDAYDSMHEMIVKYFSYHNSSVLFVNESPDRLTELTVKSRQIQSISSEKFLSFSSFNINALEIFENSPLMQTFLYDITRRLNTEECFNPKKVIDKEIINEDCLQFLKRVPEGSIHHMVTSPPYYNAREYSTWRNLYNYLHDMYNICEASYDALVPGGVFFYNIGDIFDNPHTIVKSKMGDQRIALGAYLIILFRKAGFELLDNVIWDKGETQSNRHKNDGNFTPYYQRPANVYEHMFIFKKPGADLRLSPEVFIKSNIQRFSPVIKINSKGENIYGHTAPYPPELPKLSIRTFTKEGDIVFDPFLGSGTTVFTAVKEERRGIGTEMDSQYYKLAKKFIENKLYSGEQLELNL